MLHPSFLFAAGSFLLQAYGTKADEEGLVLEHFTIATPTINPTLSLALRSEVCVQMYFVFGLVSYILFTLRFTGWQNDGHPPVIASAVSPTVSITLSPSESPVWKGDEWKGEACCQFKFILLDCHSYTLFTPPLQVTNGMEIRGVTTGTLLKAHQR